MHDPLTQIAELPNPFARRYSHARRWSDRPMLFRLWHRDPDRGGNDDSCGWFGPNLTKSQRERLRIFADDEAREPWFCALRDKCNEDPLRCEILLRGAFLMVARCLRAKITWEEASLWSAELIHNPSDNVRSKLCFLPGWHSNSQKDTPSWRAMHASDLFCCLARYILRERRPWWHHPRWHVYHWQLQCPPLQSFLRWAFSRCHKCGGRFPWGYSPIGTWDGRGPGWFRNAERVWHRECDDSRRSPAAEPVIGTQEARVDG